MAHNDVGELAGLVRLLGETQGFSELVAELKAGNSGTIDGAWGSSSALAIATLATHCEKSLIVVLPRPADLDQFADDLAAFLGRPVDVFPAWESLPQENAVADPVFGKRLKIVRQFASSQPPAVVVTTIGALLQPTPARSEIAAGTRRLCVKQELDQHEFQEWLLSRGFERVTGLQFAGEFAVRGGILDLYPADADDPLRIEFFGDEIESIRQFDVETQRTIQNLESVEISVIRAVELGTQATSECLIDGLSMAAWVALSELSDITSEGRHFIERLKDPRGYFSVEAVLAKCVQRPSVTIAPLIASSFDRMCHLQVESLERLSGPRTEVLHELAEILGRDGRVLIACHNEGEQQRLTEMLSAHDASFVARVTLCLGRVARGFRLVPQGLVVVSDNELFNRTEVRRETKKRRWESRAIDSFIELNEGDYVVHLSYGIAKYHGMRVMREGDQLEEHLELEFRNNFKMYVPVVLIQLVQKYVGGSKSEPELSLYGGTAWTNKKAKVAEAIADMASDMLVLQAQRNAKPGFACEADSKWVTEFDAAFPYVPTPDQVVAIADCKGDLERARPMDRLICGDVGYGKTEVAMRAAFKVIDSGRQVAVLVPTTVLAEQHFRSFSERMAEFPIGIGCLSRFKTAAEQREVLKGLAAGSMDLVIGTHRLVSKDVKFNDLGLVVIDEEQRFGVDVKEALKHLRLEVDVLTLSATPIPRTLHMSLLGIRDISNLTTPPQDRVAVTTHIVRWDADLIRSAIVRELNRNGQVYFVHNRVYDIHDIEAKLKSIVPEARFDVVHGQMSGTALEGAMLRYVRGQTDVLIATTIIESGVDIANANTIFIHQAENYGLADLHQLRGRVGRFKHRAYCYLVLDGKPMSEQASKRLKAIEEFSSLGAGFKIAMRDLEIRGAGNILGTEQSGHIATVGYELYCQLLESAVKKLKKEPVKDRQHVTIEIGLTGFFPSDYVPPGKPKVEIYRRLSSLASVEQLRDFEAELLDRFGPIPEEARPVLPLQELQILARPWTLTRIHLEAEFAVFSYSDRRFMTLLQTRFPKRLRIVDGKQAYFILPGTATDGMKLLGVLKTVLQPFSS